MADVELSNVHVSPRRSFPKTIVEVAAGVYLVLACYFVFTDAPVRSIGCGLIALCFVLLRPAVRISILPESTNV
jgi:hypothetical protein